MKAAKAVLFISLFCSIHSFAQMTVTITSTPNVPCDTCVMLTANVSGGTAPFVYTWTINGQIVGNASTFPYCRKYPFFIKGDTIRVLVLDAAQQTQQGSGWGPQFIQSSIDSGNTIGHKLCIVTVDSISGKNLLVWQQTTNSAVSHYNIYKQNTASQFALLASVSRDSFSTYLDQSSNPQQSSSAYEISIVDSCGFESYLEAHPYVTTIHLTISAGVPPAWNLNWNATQGYPITKYRIWRSAGGGQPVMIDSVANTVYAYTDLNPPTGLLYYTIEAVSTAQCNPSFKTTQATYSSSLSNKVNNGVIGIDEYYKNFNAVMKPNPFSSSMQIEFGRDLLNGEITLLNSVGQVLKSFTAVKGNSFILERENLPSGFYTLKISDGNITRCNKIVIADN